MNNIIKEISTVIRPKHALTQEALDTLSAILDDYERLAKDRTQPDSGDEFVIKNIRGKLSTNPESIWWSDFALAEECATHMLPASQLPSRLAGWRRRLQDVAGRDRYAAYLQTATTSADDDEKKLRADLDECMSAVYYLYSSYGIASYSRNEVTKALLATAVKVIAGVLLLAAAAAVVTTLWLSAPKDVVGFIAWLALTSIAGVCGSVVSVQRRLQDPTAASVDGVYRYITTSADWYGTSVVSPIFGALFGLLMYGLLASGLLAGTLITFNAVDGFLTPAKAGYGAVLLVFGFIAGFAEQLIPDALTRISSRALGGSEAATTTSAPLGSVPLHVIDGKLNITSAATDGKVPAPSGHVQTVTFSDSAPEAAASGRNPVYASELSNSEEG